MSDGEVARLTLEEVFNSQKKIREFLREKIKQNKYVKDIDEREKLLKQTLRSTLGFGMDEEYEKTWVINGKKEKIIFTTRWAFVRKMAYADADSKIRTDGKGGATTRIDHPPKVIWVHLRAMLVEVFPIAVRQATLNSPERFVREGVETRKDWRE